MKKSDITAISKLHLMDIKPEDIENHLLANLPTNYKVSDHFKATIKGLANENSKIRDSVVDLFLSHQDALRDGGRYDLNQYLNACKFVSYTLMGITDMKSYELTFPDRYAKHIKKYEDKGVNPKTYVAIHVSGYKKSRLVTELLERTLVPPYVLNIGLNQRAINKLAYLMDHSESEKIQLESAKGILEYTKLPEKLKQQETENEVVEGVSAMDLLRQAITEMSRNSKKMITNGKASITDIEVVASNAVKAKDE